MFGVWMWPESIRLRGADAVFGDCRRAGVTDVYFLTKGLAGTTSFLTPLAPPAEGGRDLFREALDAAHGRGIRLHAWFTSASDARYLKEHPEKGLVHYRKGPREDRVGLGDEEYLRYLRLILSDLLRRYDPDGVHLDYIRYNHLICGWGEEDRRRMAERGVNLERVTALLEKTFPAEGKESAAIFDAYRAGDEDVLRLAESRRADVLSFARALAETVRSSDKGISLSAALMPEGAFDDLAFSDLHYGQHYADLAPLMDCLLPMAYSRAYGKGGAWVREAAAGTAKHGVPVLVGLHAYEGATGLTLREDTASCEGIPGVEGVCLFREGASVWTFLRGRSLCVFNPLSTPVTALRITAGEETVRIPCRIEQDEEQEFSVPFRPDFVQAFAEEREVCAALFADKDGD